MDLTELIPMVAIPEELNDVKLPDPSLMNYYRQLNDRVIWIDDDIDVDLLEYSKYIIAWNKYDDAHPEEERKPIKIFIFSYGGRVDACFHLIDIIRLSKTPIYGYNVGIAMSAAFCILVSCHKRFGTRECTAMVHQGSSSVSGNAADVIGAVENYKQVLDRMKRIVLDRTKIPPATYSRKQKEDWYLMIDDQLKYGVVDAVVENITELY